MPHPATRDPARSSTRSFPSRPRRSGRRRVVALVVLVAVLAVAALAVLAFPMSKVPGEAQAAKDDLTLAKSALTEGHLSRARELVAGARQHVDAAQDAVGGLGADVWGALPVAGPAVDDARALVQALDDATSVAEVAVDLYPAVAGKHATLFRDGQVDRATLDRLLAGVHQAAGHLASAESALEDVQGSTPFVGATIAARRDEAAAQVDPLVERFDELGPLLDRLPAVFGFEGRRSYLVAMLNPAELRYSGGATLKFAPLTFDDGKVGFGRSIQPTDDPRMVTPVEWRKVAGNRFHRAGPHLLTSSTFAPSWSVSGQELLRAWHATRDTRHDGVIAVDVVALARLLGVTGGLDVPGYGTLTADNLVQTLVGSYDTYYPDPTVQDPLNDALIPAFETSLLDGGDYVAKARALASAADERHFAVYFRDPEVQEGFALMGLDGDLTHPPGDYLGVFTQNTNGSKVDYYQRREVSLDVTLRPDGSARNRLDVLVDNDTPPYAVPEPDPQIGYFTRWAGLALGVFLPDSVQVRHATVLGKPTDLRAKQFYEHDFVAAQMLLAPTTTGRVSLRYRVPGAATVDDDGLTYRLAVDPQGTVQPETATVTVHLPDGYVATSVPPGWSADGGGTVTFPSQALSTGQQWDIVAARRD